MEINTTNKNSGARRRQVMKVMAAALTVAGLACGGVARAETFPSGPLTMVIPFAPGGSTDIIGRLLADRLSTALGQPVVVENRGGAGGNIGAAMVAKAKPNGHTMLFGTTGILSMNDALYNNPGYKVGEDLVPVIYTASISNVLIVNNNVPADSVQALLKLMKENPGKYTFASSGNGSSTHMSGELFKHMAGVDLVHVPYRGSGQALVDLMGGQVDMLFDNAPSAVPLIKTGKVKGLAVTARQRLDVVKELPTVDESVLPGYESLSWTAIMVPGGTPAGAIERLNAEVNRILQQQDVKDKLAELGAKPTGGSTADLVKHIASERAKWGKVIESAKIPKV